MSLIIDHREKDLKKIFPSAEYKNLDLGDIHIKFKDSDTTFLLIERKTMKDLIASINDGRYREQKKRLLESGIPRDRIVYLLEGKIDDIPGHTKTLFGMIINTLFRDHIHVIKFDNIEETSFFIKRIMKKLEENDPHLMPKNLHNNTDTSQKTENTEKNGDENANENHVTDENTNHNNDSNDQDTKTTLEYLSTIKLKKKDNMTPQNCSILQLAQIPGLSVQNAKIIIDKYGSMANLVNTYYQVDKDKRINMLSELEIPISNGKKRKLGKVLSERVCNYLFNQTNT
jgi:crossover junction endonuclease MUS81